MPKTKRTRAQTGKIRQGLTEKPPRKTRKKIITKRLQIGTITTGTEIRRIKRILIFLATAWLKS